MPSNSPRRGQIGLSDPVTVLPWLGAAQADELTQRGIHTLTDLLSAYPRTHEDRTQVAPLAMLPTDGPVQIVADVTRISSRRPRRGLTITTATLSGPGGRVQAIWFNQPYLADSLRGKEQVAFFGTMRDGKLSSPEYDLGGPTSLNSGRLTPIYPQIPGITQKRRRNWIDRIIKQALPGLPEPLPAGVLAATGLPSRRRALAQRHFPEDSGSLALAARRLTFDDLFYYHLEAGRRRIKRRQRAGSRPITGARAAVREFVSGLPFNLTGDQKKAISEILDDVERPYAMARLLQGDVGAGKTVVAAAALQAAVSAGQQAAVMAPTQILAHQHYRTLRGMLGPRGITVAVATAEMTAKERERLWLEVSAGQIDVVVGTHALTGQAAAFVDLNLVVIDEQHRFGVRQRAELRSKGGDPHTLIMTATPIPRTLAASYWGDIEVSQIDELPAGRQPVATVLARPSERSRAYRTLLSEVANGAQAYIVCPLVEASEAAPARSVQEEFERLRAGPLNSIGGRLGCLHGQLAPERKRAEMEAFASGQTKVLVTTTVVEVGVDVANATVMMIEGAERFGLAQLHQLRGRVGRGRRASLCLLLSDTDEAEENERLQAMTKTNSGFELAAEDLKLRGPGQMLGTRQSGYHAELIAMFAHPKINEAARSCAQQVLDSDPELASAEHVLLSKILDSRARRWAQQS